MQFDPQLCIKENKTNQTKKKRGGGYKVKYIVFRLEM
jgi:hypothetical protein